MGTENNLKESFERLLSENSEYGRRIQRILAALATHPLSNGLSDLQAIRALTDEIHRLQTTARMQAAEIIVLKNQLENNKEVVIRELLELLNKK